jgi:nucleotide-binding universal stress UspA family protein
MFKNILVPLNGAPADTQVLDLATTLAKRSKAHLQGLHVRLQTPAQIWQDEWLDVASGILSGDLIKSIEAQAEQRAQRALDNFKSYCEQRHIPWLDDSAQPGVSASWLDLAGNQVKQVVARSRYHDLTVVSSDLLYETDPSADLVASLLLYSGRPLLLAKGAIPEKFADTIAIAWKDTAEAARAITAAMPLLENARKIVVLYAAEDDMDASKSSAHALAESLRWHGGDVTSHIVVASQNTAAQTVTSRALELGATLLVSGGYGHHRSRELVLGGFTQNLLDASPIPVLLLH